MSTITTDFITATKKIHADVRAILTTLHLIRADVKAVREQTVIVSEQKLSDQQAAHLDQKQRDGIASGSKVLNVNQPNGEQEDVEQPSGSYFGALKKSFQKSVRTVKFWFEFAALLVVIAYTYETFQTNTLTERALRIDKRAWMDIGNPAKLPDNCSILTPIQISNTGRIPARKVEIRIAAAVLPKESIPDFGLAVTQTIPTQGTTGLWFTAGVVMPNSPPLILDDFGPKNNPTSHVILQSETITAAAPMLYTPDLKDKINKGDWYVEVHGRITYDDAFGSHWIQFCKFMASHSFHFTNSAKQCVDYNDTDHSD